MGSWRKLYHSFFCLIVFIAVFGREQGILHAIVPPPQPEIELESLTFSAYLPLVSHRTVYPIQDYTIMRSYYIHTLDNLYNLGFQMGLYAAGNPINQIYLTSIQFGYPYRNSTYEYGTWSYAGKFMSISEISESVREIAIGFANGNGLFGDILIIAPGVNSSGGSAVGVIAYNHGIAWRAMLDELNYYFYINHPNIAQQVLFSGSLNAEPDFSPSTTPTTWQSGFNSINSSLALYVLAAASGCPDYYPPTEPQYGQYAAWPCNTTLQNNWDQGQLFQVSAGQFDNLIPVPEVYLSSGVTAEQWYRIALFAKLNFNIPILDWFVVTQEAACEQVPGDSTCVNGTNSPQSGYNQQFHYLNSDPYSRTPFAGKLVIDMKHYHGVP